MSTSSSTPPSPLPTFHPELLPPDLMYRSTSSSTPSIEQFHSPPSSFHPKPSSLSSHAPLISLEFLSCLQTDENIPIHKISEIIIPALLQNLAKWDEQHSPLEAMYEKARGDLSKIQKKLDILKEWDNRLNTLTKKLMLRVWESVEVSQVAIPDIDEIVSELRSHVSLPFKTSLAAKSSDIFLPAQSSDISGPLIPENAISILKWSKDFPQTEAFVNFKASYDSLSLQERNSLLYFSFFPENSLIRKKVLTYLWIGEQVIQSTATEDSEEIADPLFKVLIERGFIDPVKEKDIGDFNVCSVNPDIRPALLTIAHNGGFFDFDSDGKPTVNSRRACLVKTEEGSLQQLNMFSNHDMLLTLFNINENCLDFPSRWLSKTKNISVIHLGNWSSSSPYNYIEAENPDFLEDLCNAKRLRCLSLNGISGIRKLPNSISASENLNILDLKCCSDLEKLPRLRSLKRLTHLDMSGCYLLDIMSRDIANLSELRVLKGFNISSRKGGCKLIDLVNLKKLSKLGLYADKKTTGENGELNCLGNFRSLKTLTMSWTAPVFPKPNRNRKGIVSPSLPLGLQKLGLRAWPLSTMPSWIKPRELNSLKKLYISGGKLSALGVAQVQGLAGLTPGPALGMQMMQPTGFVMSIKILRLKFLRELNMHWEELHTSFPSLVYLEKEDCPRLSSFPFDRVWRLERGSTSG